MTPRASSERCVVCGGIRTGHSIINYYNPHLFTPTTAGASKSSGGGKGADLVPPVARTNPEPGVGAPKPPEETPPKCEACDECVAAGGLEIDMEFHHPLLARKDARIAELEGWLERAWLHHQNVDGIKPIDVAPSCYYIHANLRRVLGKEGGAR